MSVKTYSETYLYSNFPYEPKLFKYLMTADHLDTVDPRFEDVKYEFKKRVPSNAIYKVFTSKNVYLMTAKDGVQLNRQFRVFCAKDPKSKTHDLKVFIDCTGLIVLDEKTGMYKCKAIDTLVSNVINAAVCFIYHIKNNVVMNTNIKVSCIRCFMKLFNHVIDYMYKISTVPSTKNKCMILAGMYFVQNILKEEINAGYKSIIARAIDASDREVDMVYVQIEDDDFTTIKTFINKFAEIMKFNNLKVDNFLDKWMWLYGSNTPFALEYFPALSAMLTDAYQGAYLNNQKTIEKVCGNELVMYNNYVVAVIPN